MKTCCLRIAAALVIVLSGASLPDIGCFAAEDAPAQQSATSDVLHFLNIPTRSLPDGVQLVEKIATAPLLPVDRNPVAIADRKGIQRLAEFFGIHEDPALDGIRSGFVALYEEGAAGNEIGIYALQFQTEEQAKAVFDALDKDAHAGVPIRKGTLLLWLWKDSGVSAAAFQGIRDYFLSARLTASK